MRSICDTPASLWSLLEPKILPLVHKLIQVPIRFLGPNDSEFEFAALVDTGASATFYNAKTVHRLKFTPKGSCFRVKNGDGSSQYSLGSISSRIAIGAHFKGNMLDQIIQLDHFDMITGIDIYQYWYVLTVFVMQVDMIFLTIYAACQIFILNAKGKESLFKTVMWLFRIRMMCFPMLR